jgi:hypothetical protein
MNETRAREEWNRKDLGANHMGELEGLVLRALEVLGDSHALALAHGERELVGGRSAQFLEHAGRSVLLAVGATVGGQDADATDEALETKPFAIGETVGGRQRVRVVLANKFKAKAKKWALVQW